MEGTTDVKIVDTILPSVGIINFVVPLSFLTSGSLLFVQSA